MLLRCLLTLLISLGLAIPAHALLTLGVAPDKSNPLRSEAGARQLRAQLQGVLNEEVRLRVFRSEAELNEWLQRYRMVDLALVSQGFYNQQPSGSLFLLAQASANDLAVARPGLPPETLARLRNSIPELQLNISRPLPHNTTATAPTRFRKPVQVELSPGDGELQAGQKILAIPGEPPRIITQAPRQTKPKPQRPAVHPKKAAPPPAPKTKPVEVAIKQPTPVAETPAPPSITLTQELAGVSSLAQPDAQPTPVESPPLPPVMLSQGPVATPSTTATDPLPASSEPQADATSSPRWLAIFILLGGLGYLFYRRRQKSRTTDWSAVLQPLSPPAVAPPKQASLPNRAQTDGDPTPNRPAPMTRVPLPPTRKPVEVAEVPPPNLVQVPTSIPLTKEIPTGSGSLLPHTDEAPQAFLEDHQSLDLPSLAPEDLSSLTQLPTLQELDDQTQPETEENPATFGITMEEPEPTIYSTDTKPIFVGKSTTKSSSDLPPLRGDVATVNIPRLLEAAAAQPGPCILHIRGRHDEKRLHFRKGHLSNAASINRANRTKTGFLMNKVGYLLIRQGRISEEQRDQALELCKQRPKLRIGEALVELGALSRESLLEALQTQAEGIIFSLFIFPEGRYEIVADDTDTPAANDLNINLADLLSKAEAQEPEWERIRQAIPSLDATLDFPEGGRDKLGNARMTEHQKLVLSLIDGQRPIRDICIAATMLDLEVYKFLFFMVNAKILSRIS